MADYNSSLPIRTETDGDVVVKVGDGTLPSQQLAVNADGSVNITDNGASITVDATDLDIRDLAFATDKVDASGSSVSVSNAGGASAVNIQDGGNSITVDAINLDIRDLAFATDKVDASGSVVALDAPTLAALESITVQNGAGAAAVNIQDGGNSITVDGTVSASNFPATVDTNYGAVGASTLRSAAQIGNATGAADFNSGATGAQTLRVHANQGAPNSVANSWPTLVTDGTDTLAVNTDGSINVVIADATPGTPINDYNTAAAIAGGASSNHDYTVTALKTLYLNQIEASASGKMKIEVTVETGVASGVFTSRFVQFNSTAETNMSIHLENPITVAAGVRVRVIRTNRDNQSQDVYSTISGYQLP